jgi:hypothetical protein
MSITLFGTCRLNKIHNHNNLNNVMSSDLGHYIEFGINEFSNYLNNLIKAF